MRAGIGILSILIVVAIIMFVSFSGPNGGYVTTVVKSGQTGTSQANQISGRGDTGIPVSESIGLRGNPENGPLRSLVVTNVLATGPMAIAYGLQKDDEILQIGDYDVRTNNDVELAKATLYESYQRNQQLVIVRNGQKYTITPDSPLTQNQSKYFQKPGMVPSGPANAPAAAPPAPAPAQAPADQQQNLQDQLKQIQVVPTH